MSFALRNADTLLLILSIKAGLVFGPDQKDTFVPSDFKGLMKLLTF